MDLQPDGGEAISELGLPLLVELFCKRGAGHDGSPRWRKSECPVVLAGLVEEIEVAEKPGCPLDRSVVPSSFLFEAGAGAPLREQQVAGTLRDVLSSPGHNRFLRRIRLDGELTDEATVGSLPAGTEIIIACAGWADFDRTKFETVPCWVLQSGAQDFGDPDESSSGRSRQSSLRLVYLNLDRASSFTVMRNSKTYTLQDLATAGDELLPKSFTAYQQVPMTRGSQKHIGLSSTSLATFVSLHRTYLAVVDDRLFKLPVDLRVSFKIDPQPAAGFFARACKVLADKVETGFLPEANLEDCCPFKWVSVDGDHVERGAAGSAQENVGGHRGDVIKKSTPSTGGEQIYENAQIRKPEQGSPVKANPQPRVEPGAINTEPETLYDVPRPQKKPRSPTPSPWIPTPASKAALSPGMTRKANCFEFPHPLPTQSTASEQGGSSLHEMAEEVEKDLEGLGPLSPASPANCTPVTRSPSPGNNQSLRPPTSRAHSAAASPTGTLDSEQDLEQGLSTPEGRKITRGFRLFQALKKVARRRLPQVAKNKPRQGRTSIDSATEPGNRSLLSPRPQNSQDHSPTLSLDSAAASPIGSLSLPRSLDQDQEVNDKTPVTSSDEDNYATPYAEFHRTPAEISERLAKTSLAGTNVSQRKGSSTSPRSRPQSIDLSLVASKTLPSPCRPPLQMPASLPPSSFLGSREENGMIPAFQCPPSVSVSQADDDGEEDFEYEEVTFHTTLKSAKQQKVSPDRSEYAIPLSIDGYEVPKDKIATLSKNTPGAQAGHRQTASNPPSTISSASTQRAQLSNSRSDQQLPRGNRATRLPEVESDERPFFGKANRPLPSMLSLPTIPRVKEEQPEQDLQISPGKSVPPDKQAEQLSSSSKAYPQLPKLGPAKPSSHNVLVSQSNTSQLDGSKSDKELSSRVPFQKSQIDSVKVDEQLSPSGPDPPLSVEKSQDHLASSEAEHQPNSTQTASSPVLCQSSSLEEQRTPESELDRPPHKSSNKVVRRRSTSRPLPRLPGSKSVERRISRKADAPVQQLDGNPAPEMKLPDTPAEHQQVDNKPSMPPPTVSTEQQTTSGNKPLPLLPETSQKTRPSVASMALQFSSSSRPEQISNKKSGQPNHNHQEKELAGGNTANEPAPDPSAKPRFGGKPLIMTSEQQSRGPQRQVCALRTAPETFAGARNRNPDSPTSGFGPDRSKSQPSLLPPEHAKTTSAAKHATRDDMPKVAQPVSGSRKPPPVKDRARRTTARLPPQ